MFGISSILGAVCARNFCMVFLIWLYVIGSKLVIVLGYLLLGLTLELTGGWGKNAAARALLFCSLEVASHITPLCSPKFRVGILVLPPSVVGFEM